MLAIGLYRGVETFRDHCMGKLVDGSGFDLACVQNRHYALVVHRRSFH